MDTKKLIVLIKPEDAGKRIDGVLTEAIPNSSRSNVQKLIEEGLITIDGVNKVTKNLKVKAGWEVTINFPEPKKVDLKAENIPLEIIYEDDDLMVINKPRGMVVHPAPGNESGTMVNAIMHHCGDRLSTINGEIRPGIVHRIDKDTSGLIMVAKNDVTHRSLADQLEKHTVNRKYVALVYNNFNEEEGTIDKPIGSDTKIWHKKVVRDTNSKHAVTHYKVIKRFGKHSVIEAKLETGRTHQIRVHMSYINHPLVGDDLYGPSKNPFNIKGQMLHAFLLGFIHPTTKEYLEFKVAPPTEFIKVIKKLGDEEFLYQL